MIQIYCGEGKGKTTAAIGLAVRAAGAGKSVLFSQFFKDGTSSEVAVLKAIPGIDYTCFPEQLGFCRGMDEEKRARAHAAYQQLFEQIRDKQAAYDVIILDEIISIYQYQLVSRQEVLDFLQKYGKEKEIILTGRNPAEELVTLADYVSEIAKVKHPFDLGVKARIGIEY